MDVGVPRCQSGNPATVSAALVDPQTGGQTKSSESRRAARHKRPRIVEFGTLYKRPVSNSGRQSVDMMMKHYIRSLFFVSLPDTGD
ncbi:jg24465 [Pararge aegeria aegeria]|uniref:Jg24465 protein n=1 Tax=Pararge aegeria aegeria TaxID=348720 RepID=A0A8S4RIP5_9NEOP|nr:jg24465 [Pararge aegeria aegeria]